MREYMKEHPMKIAFLFYWILVFILVYFLIVAFYPFKIFEMVEPITIIEPAYAGEVAFYKVHYKKYRQVSARVSKQLVNGVNIAFAEVVVNAPVGENDLGGYLPIPEYAKPGTHTLIWTVTYVMHFPFYDRDIEYRHESKPFTILPSRRPNARFTVK
jgi:predicted membrane-bound mannosyltransferase